MHNRLYFTNPGAANVESEACAKSVTPKLCIRDGRGSFFSQGGAGQGQNLQCVAGNGLARFPDTLAFGSSKKKLPEVGWGTWLEMVLICGAGNILHISFDYYDHNYCSVLCVVMLFHYGFSELERLESVTFILPHLYPALLTIFAGQGGAARVFHGVGPQGCFMG